MQNVVHNCVLVTFSSREVITYLHSEKIPVFLISGGFKQLNVPLAHRLNIPSEHVYSVELLFDSDGKELNLNSFFVIL